MNFILAKWQDLFLTMLINIYGRMATLSETISFRSYVAFSLYVRQKETVSRTEIKRRNSGNSER
jgi:hypothetical protein